MTTYVLPGDIVPTPSSSKLKLGPGLLQLAESSTPSQGASGAAPTSDGSSTGPIITATKAGILKHSSNNLKWWIESNSWRYVPAAQESVIGQVIGKAGDGFRVDIASAHAASLDALAFEGASKRNRPNLKVGSLIYARVSLAHKDMEPELECFDATTHKAEGFGELKGGFMVKCSLGLSRSMLDPKHFLLPLLGSKFPLEAAVGTNGRVWFKTPEAKHTVAVVRCIQAVDERQLDQTGVAKFLGGLEL